MSKSSKAPYCIDPGLQGTFTIVKVVSLFIIRLRLQILVQSLCANYDEFRIHMNALQQMVKMRGGLKQLGWGGVLHMFLSWLAGGSYQISRIFD